MSQASDEQVTFRRPPVVEKAMGVEFEPIPGWAAPHFGLLWSEVRKDYPTFELQPPLLSQIEQTGKQGGQPPGIAIQFGDPFRFRSWFIHENRAQLLQVQDSRLIVNWRKLSQEDPYPHYKRFRPVFEAEWARFTAFLARNGFPAPRVLQCELTYVNHFPRGDGWRDYTDLPRVTPCWNGTGNVLPAPESVAWSSRHLLPEGRGRLHVALQPVIRHADGREVLQMTLTARGGPAGGSTAEVLEWFDLGRKWLFEAFKQLTSAEMQQFWNKGE